MTLRKGIDYEIGSGNVFADLGLPNPEERLAKAEIALRILDMIGRRKLTQSAAARILGVSQPKVSALMNGRLEGFSMERLLRFLNALDCDVEIVIRPRRRSKRPASIRVVRAARPPAA